MNRRELIAAVAALPIPAKAVVSIPDERPVALVRADGGDQIPAFDLGEGMVEITRYIRYSVKDASEPGGWSHRTKHWHVIEHRDHARWMHSLLDTLVRHELAGYQYKFCGIADPGNLNVGLPS